MTARDGVTADIVMRDGVAEPVRYITWDDRPAGADEVTR